MTNLLTDAIQINEILKEHIRVEGMTVSEGEICQCGYWTGNERAGKDRPLGINDPLNWHRALLIADINHEQLQALQDALKEAQTEKTIWQKDLKKVIHGLMCSEHMGDVNREYSSLCMLAGIKQFVGYQDGWTEEDWKTIGNPYAD